MKKAFTRLLKLKLVQSMTNAERIRKNSMATGLPWNKTFIFQQNENSCKLYVQLEEGGFTISGKDLDEAWDKLNMDYFESLDIWTMMCIILIDMISSNLLYVLSTDIQDNLLKSVKALRRYLSSGNSVERKEVIQRFVDIRDMLSIFINQKAYWQMAFVEDQKSVIDDLNDKNMAKLHEFLLVIEKMLKR